ncbi:metabolite traffic protein EboE [Deinococcus sp.]|uniref:metabolite traffic protein EboE n=1 Tax=Deinococcus sp. TaxID=47478 RepID=UPI003B59E061
MQLASELHLTYCTNIHPSTGLADVKANLERYAVPLRERLAAGQPFGLGLRLSGEESRELLEPGQLSAFRTFLDERGLYVFTINGFPYGPFHGQAVKAQVHAPDWQESERVAYTERLIDILAALLPEGQDGGISTSPLSYKAWVDESDPALWATLTENVMRVVEKLARLHQSSGQLIHLDIEPEPDGLLERSEELVHFFTAHLLGAGASQLAERLGISLNEAKVAVARHVQVCFDTCHIAVAHEVPGEALSRYQQAGMRIGKIQISSALRLTLDTDAAARRRQLDALLPFAESTYLHQVIARSGGDQLMQFPDLPPALSALSDAEFKEARVHFHVPVFAERFGAAGLASTQPEIVQTFAALAEQPFTRHLEIETYTWDVLPPELKSPLLEMIEREYRWVLDQLSASGVTALSTQQVAHGL